MQYILLQWEIRIKILKFIFYDKNPKQQNLKQQICNISNTLISKSIIEVIKKTPFLTHTSICQKYYYFIKLPQQFNKFVSQGTIKIEHLYCQYSQFHVKLNINLNLKQLLNLSLNLQLKKMKKIFLQIQSTIIQCFISNYLQGMYEDQYCSFDKLSYLVVKIEQYKESSIVKSFLLNLQDPLFIMMYIKIQIHFMQINFRSMSREQCQQSQTQRQADSLLQLAQIQVQDGQANQVQAQAFMEDMQMNRCEQVLPQGFTGEITRLPSNFMFLLQVWNTVKTYSHEFQEDYKGFSITKCSNIIKDQKSYLRLITRLLDFYSNDLLNQKNQLIKKDDHVHFSNVLRFCFENGLKNVVYQGCWPMILLRLTKKIVALSQDQNLKQFANNLNKIAQHTTLPTPDIFQLRLQIAAAVCQLAPDTLTFKKAIENRLQRQSKHKRNQSQKLKKTAEMQSKLKQINNRPQNFQAAKQESVNEQRIHTNEEQFGLLTDRYQNETQNLQVEQIKLLSGLYQFQQQSQEINCNMRYSTHVRWVGVDAKANQYWNVLGVGLIICLGNQWYYVKQKQAEDLLRKLGEVDAKGYLIFQKYLLEKEKNIMIQNHQQQSNDVLQAINNLQYNSSTPKHNCISSKNKMADLLTSSQQKLSKYLAQRNSRWCNKQQKQQFNEFIQNLQHRQLPQIACFLKDLNQRICVVQSTYELQHKTTAVATTAAMHKTRKIQTKLWGISEKYKNSWNRLCDQLTNYNDLYVAVFVLCANIDKYTSKNRRKRNEMGKGEEVKGDNGSFGNVSRPVTKCVACEGEQGFVNCKNCKRYFHHDCMNAIDDDDV